MLNEDNITKTIEQRFSCRHFKKEPIHDYQWQKLLNFIQSPVTAPFGSQARFELINATNQDRKALRGLGTYGFIKDAPAFITGASKLSEYYLEDYGYMLERIILFATSLGLGTCWLGGTFTKSRFASQMNLCNDELIPAVVALGHIKNPKNARVGLVSRLADSHKRLPWKKLFFNYTIGVPLLPNEAGAYATPLKMVQLAPSASNKQPWRVMYCNETWRFFLQRTPGYRNDPIKKILKLCDLQRLDIGIAMCHFGWSAKAMGLQGKWYVEESLQHIPHPLGEYIVSWISQT